MQYDDHRVVSSLPSMEEKRLLLSIRIKNALALAQLSAAILVISVRLVLYELPCVKDEGRNNRDRAHYI
eukprot:scaffold8876_cov108-Skeletonema_marinoi.AAC.8